jgi:hypothetical protein
MKTDHHKIFSSHIAHRTSHTATDNFLIDTNGLKMGCGSSAPEEVVAGTREENPKVFFDISVGGKPKGRIIMELRADMVPKTAEVRSFCEDFDTLGSHILTLTIAIFCVLELPMPMYWRERKGKVSS